MAGLVARSPSQQKRACVRFCVAIAHARPLPRLAAGERHAAEGARSHNAVPGSTCAYEDEVCS